MYVYVHVYDHLPQILDQQVKTGLDDRRILICQHNISAQIALDISRLLKQLPNFILSKNVPWLCFVCFTFSKASSQQWLLAYNKYLPMAMTIYKKH